MFDKERFAKIAGSVEAQGRGALALALALDTDVTPEQAHKVLSAVPVASQEDFVPNGEAISQALRGTGCYSLADVLSSEPGMTADRAGRIGLAMAAAVKQDYSAGADAFCRFMEEFGADNPGPDGGDVSAAGVLSGIGRLGN